VLNFNHGATKPKTKAGDLTAGINRLIDSALVEANARQAPRRYLGASILGGPCQRAIQYGYTQAKGEGFSGKTLRIFAAGHAFEDMTAADLRRAGFDLRTAKPDGGQYGFEAADGCLQGHIDGVLVGGPAIIAYPALWEHKALGPKSWNAVVKQGVTVAKPEYAAQMALYQAYLDLTDNPAIFTARNRDTQEIYWEAVPFAPALAQAMSDRGVNIIQASDAGETLPRGFAKRDHWICRNCQYRDPCWNA
jgi:hypothetical protein